MKIAVVGTGAMGSIYAARLARAGHEVWAIDAWEQHVTAMQQHGLLITGPDGEFRSPEIQADGDLASAGICDLYIIATKASGVAAAAQAVAAVMGPASLVLTIQNGLGAGERLAQHIREDAIMLGVAEGFGASMVGPGHARHTSMKMLRLGGLSGGKDTRLDPVAEAWRSGGFEVQIFDDIQKLIWEKLLCNVTLSAPCTAFACTVAELRADPERWAIALGCAREAYAVGCALGVAFSFGNEAAALRYVTDFAERVGAAKPSMSQDHEAGRRSELAAINGAIAPLAAKLGLSAPHNATLSAVLRAREQAFQR